MITKNKSIKTKTDKVGFLEKAKSLLGKSVLSHLPTFFSGAIIGITSYIGFLAEPLKDVLYRTLWKENAEIEILLPTKLSVQKGDQVKLKVLVNPKGSIPLSNGTLTIEYGNEFSQIGEQNTVMQINSSKNTIYPSDSTNLTLKPLREGSYGIKATFITKYSKFEDVKIISVFKPSGSQGVSLHNFSGQWNFDIDDLPPITANIVDDNGNISGRYFINHTTSGTIIGTKDGEVFNISLRDIKSNNNCWKIESKWAPRKDTNSGEFIEIIGTAVKIKIKDDEWITLDSTSRRFRTYHQL